MKNILLVATFLFCGLVFAHEGHDHDAPGLVQAPKGGIIKSTEDVHIEVVAKGKDVKVYFYSQDLKPLDLTTYKVGLKAEIPRTKKSEVLAQKVTANLVEAQFDAKGAHRYVLTVSVAGEKHGHEDKLNFNIEPRK